MTLDLRPDRRLADLPSTQALPPIRSRGLGPFGAVARASVRQWWRIHVHDELKVPANGPVILAANHTGVVDGPLLVLATPRPVWALAKRELFSGSVGRVLERAGQIPLDRHAPDPGALRRAIHVLRSGHGLGIFPEGRRGHGDFANIEDGLGYLALVTGAPIVPVALLGTRRPGDTAHQSPPRGATIHIVYGRAIEVPRTPWPRTAAMRAELTAFLQPRLAEHVEQAARATGMPLPGPLPVPLPT